MKKFHLMALPLAAALALPVMAQNSMPPAPPSNSSTTDSSQNTQQQPTTNSTDQTNQNTQSTTDQNNQNNPNATTADQNLQARQPLKQETHEGFWGHLNPFARKKYVQRQLTPVKDRLNELDELSANNAKAIKDVDSRATEGIRLASLKANEADQHAIDAGNKANQANQLATDASNRLNTVQSAVQNIDQFKADSQIELRFRPGQSVLSKKAKSALDDLAQNVQDKKGYIIEVQGFSSGRGAASVENSQRMANSVVRYLVINHDIPVYRIYTVGMGNAVVTSEDGKKKHVSGGRVEISLLKNAIGDIQVPQNNAGSGAPMNNSSTPSTGGTTATPSQSNPPASNNVTPSTNQAPNTNQNPSTPNTQSQPPQTTTEQQPK